MFTRYSVAGGMQNYIGKTEKTLEDMIWDQEFDARHKEPEMPWGKHVNECHGEGPVRLNNISVVAAETDAGARKVRERVVIHEQSPRKQCIQALIRSLCRLSFDSTVLMPNLFWAHVSANLSLFSLVPNAYA